MLPLLLALVAIVALLPIVAPLLRGHRPIAGRASYDQAVYRDQLNELDRDIARGLITSTEADTARLEIQRRLLVADGLIDRPASTSRSPIMAAIVVVIALGGAVGSYLWIGAPTMKDVPYAARQQPQQPQQQAQQEQQPPGTHDVSDPDQMRKAAEALAAKLQANPNDASNWVLYARTLTMLEEWPEAADAYGKAIALGANQAPVLAGHAEALIVAADGTVTPTAATELRSVLKADPQSPLARFYLAVADLQAGEPQKAIDGIQSLAADMPKDSPVRERLTAVLAGAAKSAGISAPPLAAGREPTAEERADAEDASMTDEQRQAKIRSMVEKLANDLKTDSNNADGWMQLGRSYGVLNEMDKATAAYDKAAALKPGDPSVRLEELETLAGDLRSDQKVPPVVIDLVHDLLKTAPDEPVVLWFGGMVAIQEGHRDDARQLWQKLMGQMQPGGDDFKMVQTALGALDKK